MTAAPASSQSPSGAAGSRDASVHDLDTQPLREIAALAALVCETPCAALTIGAAEIAWYRPPSTAETALSPDHEPFDLHTLLCGDVFEVENAAEDERFALLGTIAGAPPIGFYAGAPIVTPDGQKLGVIAVFGSGVRRLSPTQRSALQAFARLAGSQIALRNELQLSRAAARESLQQMERLYQNTFEQAPIGIAYADRSGNFLRCNPAFGEMLGFSLSELERTSIGQLTYEPDFDHNASEISRLWRGEIDSYSLEKRYMRKDRSPVWVRVTAALVRNANGDPECSVGYLEAINERKRMEQALQRNKNLLESVISDVPFAIMACDTNGRIFMSNPAAVELFAISANGATRDNTPVQYSTEVDVFLPDGVTSVPDHERPLARALRGEQIGNKELIFRRKGAEPRTTIASARQLLAQDGECLGAVGVAQDITDRKEAELELERIHKELLDASRLAGMAEVASNVLHNVGNVLTSVNVSAGLVAECVKDAKVAGLGRAAALLKEHEQDLGSFLTADERGRKLPAYLAQLAEHLQGNQRLALKELGALRDNIDHIKETVAMQQSYAKLCGVAETVVVADLIEDSLRMNAAALARHGITVRREIDDTVPPISVDKHKILQILVNLIRNAKYACDESGRAEKLVIIRVDSDASSVSISVIDNGIGIHPDNLGRLFRHGFTTRKTGHGFGLHSGALAAKELGGSLTASSDGPGCGASFVLRLPRGAANG